MQVRLVRDRQELLAGLTKKAARGLPWETVCSLSFVCGLRRLHEVALGSSASTLHAVDHPNLTKRGPTDCEADVDTFVDAVGFNCEPSLGRSI